MHTLPEKLPCLFFLKLFPVANPQGSAAYTDPINPPMLRKHAMLYDIQVAYN